MEASAREEIELVCASGSSLFVPYDILSESEVLRCFVDEKAFVEGINQRIELPITESALHRAVQYLRYKKEYHDKRGNIEDFPIKEEESLSLLEVAAFLRL